MSRDKDIRFPEKKVDSSWKDQISRDKTAAEASSQKAAASQPLTSREFMNFLRSLATQALMSMGQIPHPMSGQAEVDLAAAKEMIDLLALLKQKTRGNCSPEEASFFESAVTELQMKFSQLA